EADERLGEVHSGADRADRALRAQPVERAVRTGECLLLALLGVVDVQDVDAIEAEPLQALLERAERTVVAVVEDRLERRRLVPDRATRLPRGAGAQEPAHLGRERVRVPRLPPEREAEPPLGEAVPVQRRRVEEADPALPGPLDGREGGVLVDGLEQAAERRSPESEPRDHLIRT